LKTKDNKTPRTKKKRFSLFDKNEETLLHWKIKYPIGLIFCHRTFRKEKEIADTQSKSIANRYKPLHKIFLLDTCFSP